MAASTSSTSLTDAEVCSAVECATGEKVTLLRRVPSAYRTSFAIEEIDVELAVSNRRDLLIKYVDRSDLIDAAKLAKPAFLFDVRREIEVYRSILATADVGTARFYAAGAEGGWLLIERFSGVELYQDGEMETWERVAAWLAALHVRFAASVSGFADSARLLRYNSSLLQAWPARARQFLDAAALRSLNPILNRYKVVIDRILSLRPTFIHGEFYASNVLVSAERVCPVDWELAAIGPGLIDLAALTSGKWSEPQRRQLAAAYHAKLVESDPAAMNFEDMLESLEYCRLHLAVQWLGWAKGWNPPAEHRQDWLREALQSAERLGLSS